MAQIVAIIIACVIGFLFLIWFFLFNPIFRITRHDDPPLLNFEFEFNPNLHNFEIVEGHLVEKGYSSELP